MCVLVRVRVRVHVRVHVRAYAVVSQNVTRLDHALLWLSTPETKFRNSRGPHDVRQYVRGVCFTCVCLAWTL